MPLRFSMRHWIQSLISDATHRLEVPIFTAGGKVRSLIIMYIDVLPSAVRCMTAARESSWCPLDVMSWPGGVCWAESFGSLRFSWLGCRISRRVLVVIDIEALARPRRPLNGMTNASAYDTSRMAQHELIELGCLFGRY